MSLAEEGEAISFIPIEDEGEDELGTIYPDELPLLVLKNTVLFPGIVIPITVGRDKSVKAVKHAHDSDKIIAVITQRDANIEDPGQDDLYETGTIAKILKLLKMPDGTMTAVIQGKSRMSLEQVTSTDPYHRAQVRHLSYEQADDAIEFTAKISSIRGAAENIINLSPAIPNEANVVLGNIKSDSFLLDFIASNLNVDVQAKQDILDLHGIPEKADVILTEITKELHMLEIKDQIESKVRGDLEKQQRDYFLNQQLKTIQEELGDNPQAAAIKELEKRAHKMKWTEEVSKGFAKDLARVRRMNPQVAEYSIMLNYLEMMLDLPWGVYTKDNYDLQKVRKVLDQDHFGLDKVKDRIIEHLAVLKLKEDMKAPILCLVGPPGVGKTSLGKSIARALDRNFVRMSLGGLHDESEIRGHRKTYIGAMPGRVIKSIKKAESSNPVFILDEIDKVGKDMRGDPSSALLEVLDPEQNTRFYDNYLEHEYDLSKVLFIATANNLNSIQPALLDRMEIIEISGYSQEEKREIAKKHLIPKQRKAHGLKATDLKIAEATLDKIISQYTRESGVRNLDRQIAGVMRHIARKVAGEEEYVKTVKADQIKTILGPRPYSMRSYQVIDAPGVSVGLAWTRVGGDILYIETSLSQGKSKLLLTGNLGDVMKESATTALSYIKSHSEQLSIPTERWESMDIHVHVPAGGIPKDGPSAGITMMTSIASAILEKPVQPYLAMTGEITLRGQVLPVGGIKEKILAARRAGMKKIMLCEENRRHVEEIEDEYLVGLEFVYVDKMQQVLQEALDIWHF